MAEVLVDTLKTIEKYRLMSPHYTELFDILSEILILREEYRQNMGQITFPLDEKLIAIKLSGGLPLLDFTIVNFDYAPARDYFLRLLEIAEKRMPGETKEFVRQIREGELDFAEVIRHSFDVASEGEFAKDVDED